MKRDNAIDILKIIAIFGVLFIHTSSGGLENSAGSADWFFSVFYGSLARASVPVFLMCSGALLLDPARELTIRKLYTKYLPRILTAMIFWAMAYKIINLIFFGTVNWGTILSGLKEVLVFNQEFHFYYIHIILIVYVFLPMTRLITTHASKQVLRYILAVWFVLGLLYPTFLGIWPFTLFSGFTPQWTINLVYSGIGYGILGYYLCKYQIRRQWVYPALFISGFALVLAGSVYAPAAESPFFGFISGGMSPVGALMAVGLFGTIISAVKPNAKSNIMIEKLSKATFCIYLVHVMFLIIFKRYGFTVGFLPTVISIPIIVVVNFVCSYIVYEILSRIPVIRKYLV